MMSEIQDGLSALKGLGGVRRILWVALLVGLSLVVFESVTQYFSVGSLQARVELLDELRQIEGSADSKKMLEIIHSNLVDEARETYQYARNPGSYILEIAVRFVQGAYISLPVFWLFFKLVRIVVRNAKSQMDMDENTKKMGLFLGSFVFSGAAWMATILGVASVLWNKSDSLWISWLMFPILSAVFLLLLLVWLMILGIFVGGAKKRAESENE